MLINSETARAPRSRASSTPPEQVAASGVGRYLTVDEVAKITKRHPNTIRIALRGGALHGRQSRSAGTWRVSENCIEPWLSGLQCPHVDALPPKRLVTPRARR